MGTMLKARRVSLWMGLALAVVIGVPLGLPTASATSTCTFTTSEATMTLDADCTTDATIFVPDGVTLDGAGHTITAVDPPSPGHFLAAVVQNAGATAFVTQLTVTTSALADVCDEGVDRLRGILFDTASGSITNNMVVNVNQGASGCQEGNGIEVRNAPFDGTHSATVTVIITGNTVTNYQKNGITANGDVKATIQGNVVIGAGPVNYIAQNGVQFGFGATGTASGNTIEKNYYTVAGTTACGLLFFGATGVSTSKNAFSGNQMHVCNFGQRGGGKPSL